MIKNLDTYIKVPVILTCKNVLEYDYSFFTYWDALPISIRTCTIQNTINAKIDKNRIPCPQSSRLFLPSMTNLPCFKSKYGAVSSISVANVLSRITVKTEIAPKMAEIMKTKVSSLMFVICMRLWKTSMYLTTNTKINCWSQYMLAMPIRPVMSLLASSGMPGKITA